MNPSKNLANGLHSGLNPGAEAAPPKPSRNPSRTPETSCNSDVRFVSSSIRIPKPQFPHSFPLPVPFAHQNLSLHFQRAKESILNLFSRGPHPILCSSSLAVARKREYDEERVLISEVLIRNKDGEVMERRDLEEVAASAVKSCRPNAALTVREVQEDVHRIVESGLFSSCMPVAVDTRDGIRLVFQVEPNQEFHGLICEGASVLPAKFLEDKFRAGYGKIVNIRHMDDVIKSINGWYTDRGLFGLVSGIEMLSGGMLRLQVSEAEVNNIMIRFLDRRTVEPTVGKTRPETILKQLTTKKGQVYSLLQSKRDVETILTMGIMEDVTIIPQPAGVWATGRGAVC